MAKSRTPNFLPLTFCLLLGDTVRWSHWPALPSGRVRRGDRGSFLKKTSFFRPRQLKNFQRYHYFLKYISSSEEEENAYEQHEMVEFPKVILRKLMITVE